MGIDIRPYAQELQYSPYPAKDIGHPVRKGDTKLPIPTDTGLNAVELLQRNALSGKEISALTAVQGIYMALAASLT